MKVRLIDADALKSKAVKMFGFGENKYVPLKAIQTAPTIDAEVVVRCGKCKHCAPETMHCDHPMGTALPLPRKPDDFCSYGERKDGETDVERSSQSI